MKFIVENREGIFVEEEETIIEENEENEEAMFEDILEENREEVTLKFYTSQSLTSNKRHVLLFNVSKPFEVLIHDFDHEYGQKEGIPLEKCRKTKTCSPNLCSAKIQVLRFVSAQKVQIGRYNNSSNHTHTLEESEVLKHSNAVQKLVKEEAVKNYPPPTIVSAIKDYATRKLDLGTSVKGLKRKEVLNIKQKVNKVQKNNSFGGNTNIDSNIAKCIIF
ncbi:3461_t:CDS:2 [Gigaspora margarita]|uniref:3461_t:CDS:1 n=1 Tax=Gigaspora margarita TaxID=4874 RepID=A0ABM8W3F8_GIGMA|nr:3461_t:CDS:2 [Gigaspora margarita]